MTVLSGQTIRERGVFTPFEERSLHAESGTSYGLSCAGYDVRVRERVVLPPSGFVLASSIEHFAVPPDLVAVVHDKSSLARLKVAVQNTVGEPGWRGYLTLELTNHAPVWTPSMALLADAILEHSYGARLRKLNALTIEQARYTTENTITLLPGQPVAQILLHRLDAPAERPYVGRYQDQPPEPVPARRLTGEEEKF